MTVDRNGARRRAARTRFRALLSPVGWACALWAVSPAHAQTPTEPHPPTPSPAPVPANSREALPTVVVTGNPLGRAEPAAPVVVLEGEALARRRGATLGETLDGLPGVSATYFGPNASRPIIRGLDGERIRVLQNSGAAVDASSLSFDHAVPLDPLVVDRVEVLRGPAALLYGGSAVGGVVNVLDHRIARTPVRGVTGTAELRVGGAASSRSGAAVVEGGNGQVAVHADAFSRRSGDLRVPRYVPRTAEGEGEATDRIGNSQSRARGGALGAALTFDRGYLGTSVDTYHHDYGVVVEPEVSIRMRRERHALAGEWRPRAGAWRALRMQLNHSDYRHDELEGDEVGTRFRSRGTDGRVELVHGPVGALAGAEGVVGLQLERTDFAALGDEAFVPSTRTGAWALFVLEEWTAGPLRWSAGLRREDVRVRSRAGEADPDAGGFGPAAQRRFGLNSGSLGVAADVGGGWRVSGSLAYTERAPTFYELYADGLHVATGAYERGDPAQRKERGTHLELGAHWQQVAGSFKVSLFTSRFARYIALESTGESVVEPGEDGEDAAYPVYAFRGVKARLHGVEVEARRRVARWPVQVELDARLDWVRATHAQTGEPLPRIAPARLALGAQAGRGRWQARAEVQHAARQSRVPRDDVPTPSHTVLHLQAGYRMQTGPVQWTWFLLGRNLTDRLAYNAASIRTVRELAPLPGRSIEAGLRASF